MSVYEGTRAAQEYRAGVDLGREYAHADLAAHAAVGAQASELRSDATEALRYATSRRWAAWKLGLARGYRDIIRTQDERGRWGT